MHQTFFTLIFARLLSPNSSQWLPLSLPYVPLPSPLVHDPDIDLRYDRKVSIQEFYDTQFVARFGYDPVELTAPGTDRLHFCCAQFIVSRDAVHRNNASVYVAICRGTVLLGCCVGCCVRYSVACCVRYSLVCWGYPAIRCVVQCVLHLSMWVWIDSLESPLGEVLC